MKFIKDIIYIITNYSSSLLNGLKNTLIIALLAFVIGLVLGKSKYMSNWFQKGKCVLKNFR